LGTGWTDLVIDTIDPEEHFTIDPFDDLASTQKPTLTIRQADVKYVHAFVSKELEIIVISVAIRLT
jgi:Ras GTPase-activating-like protein IQGAP2/3